MSSEENMVVLDRDFVSAAVKEVTGRINHMEVQLALYAADKSMDSFTYVFGGMMESVHDNAHTKGWWDRERNFGETIALIHSELSEALEAARTDPPVEGKIPGVSAVAEELADAILRIMDYCEAMEINLAGAILAKHKYNKSRPYRHGKKF